MDRNRRGLRAAAFWLGALLCVAGGSASAAAVVINSDPTTLTSTADRMISYREQSHMWQTSDGGTHVVINRGASGGDALALNSSYDGGATWITAVATLPSTGITSTSDGYLANDDLYVTYSGQANDIRFAHFRYNVTAKTWALISTQMVYSTSSAIALTPAMAVDAMGTRWLAFTNQDIATSMYSIKMMRQDAGSNTWVDTGFSFGTPDNVSNERSGRPIATATGMGIVYTLHQNVYWAQRNNAWPATASWARSLVYTNREPDKDPYGTHYNVVADAQNNLHLVWVDGGQLVYSRFLSSTQAWDPFKVLTPDIRATYMQVVVSMNNVVIICNNNSSLGVYQSSDDGNSFVYTQVLRHPTAVGKISYANPREEAPGHSSTPIPVLQQYVDGQTQHALFFPVPVITVPKQ